MEQSKRWWIVEWTVVADDGPDYVESHAVRASRAMEALDKARASVPEKVRRLAAEVHITLAPRSKQKAEYEKWPPEAEQALNYMVAHLAQNDPPANTAEGKLLIALADYGEEYERRHYPIAPQCRIIALPDFGCYVRVIDGTLFDCAMPADVKETGGEVAVNGWLADEDNWGEVSAPGSQEFLDAVNREFGTSFRMDQFPGR